MKARHTTIGFVAGAAGSLAGLAAMRLYWKVATALRGTDPRTMTKEDAPHALDEVGLAGRHHEKGEPSTAAIGRIAYETATGEAPTEGQKEALSYGVHWGYGVATSALYGALRGHVGPPDVEGGVVFGTALWALGDELTVPLMGLSKGPTAYPVAQHLHRFGAHLAFGLATAFTTQAVLGLAARTASPPSRRRLAWSALRHALAYYVRWKAARRVLGAGWKLFGRTLIHR